MQGVIEGQLDSIYAVLKDDIFKAVIAYEPIWAIGTGLTATSEQAQEAHRILRKKLALIDSMYAQRVLIIYGGSVRASNAAELLSMPDIDGLLVGGASLVSEEFITICRAGMNL
jgi:triosephosphate isomerase